MARRPKNSRWRRLPGAFRFHEQKPADPGQEEQRISLFLKAEWLDVAAEMATQSGRTTQDFCADLLAEAIASERARRRLEDEEARHGPLEGFRAIEDDPVYLSEWKAAGSPGQKGADQSPVVIHSDDPFQAPTAAIDVPAVLGSPKREALPVPASESLATGVVLRHAGIGAEEDPTGLLPSLRRGEGVGPASARELLTALEDLETSLSGATRIDRTLAYALHRLAFEGQILLTDAWSGGLADPSTVDILRLVQEGVDRVLSGEDIRYYPRDGAPEILP